MELHVGGEKRAFFKAEFLRQSSGSSVNTRRSAGRKRRQTWRERLPRANRSRSRTDRDAVSYAASDLEQQYDM